MTRFLSFPSEVTSRDSKLDLNIQVSFIRTLVPKVPSLFLEESGGIWGTKVNPSLRIFLISIWSCLHLYTLPLQRCVLPNLVGNDLLRFLSSRFPISDRGGRGQDHPISTGGGAFTRPQFVALLIWSTVRGSRCSYVFERWRRYTIGSFLHSILPILWPTFLFFFQQTQ